MPYMNAVEAARAMDWARAHGHTDEEAIDLVNYIVNRAPLKMEHEEKKETKE